MNARVGGRSAPGFRVQGLPQRAGWTHGRHPFPSAGPGPCPQTSATHVCSPPGRHEVLLAHGKRKGLADPHPSHVIIRPRGGRRDVGRTQLLAARRGLSPGALPAVRQVVLP